VATDITKGDVVCHSVFTSGKEPLWYVLNHIGPVAAELICEPVVWKHRISHRLYKGSRCHIGVIHIGTKLHRCEFQFVEYVSHQLHTHTAPMWIPVCRMLFTSVAYTPMWIMTFFFKFFFDYARYSTKSNLSFFFELTKFNSHNYNHNSESNKIFKKSRSPLNKTQEGTSTTNKKQVMLCH